MSSIALDAALADIDTVFNGFASPDETGCGHCHAPEETAYLRTPYVRIPVDVVRYYLYEVPDLPHSRLRSSGGTPTDDHAAVMRRLLPQGARAMADGSLGSIAYGAHGLTRADWRSWPAAQVAAIEAFLYAWWQDALTTPEPPYPIEDIFETCVTIARSVTPFLEGWTGGPAADAHLVHLADVWLYDLLSDASPFSWWSDDSEDTGIADLRAWLAGPGAERLRAAGEDDLALRCEVQTLPEGERWTHPYWSNPSATN
ncbi:hypothetical protein ABZ848_43050 [Streptomyces sp. NPDC047081]|uniref:hypothetical protein n=1 Tax=Streptomyces sp. NPDC047081 TaxID=3154706 RepID=UPI0033F32E2D